MFARVCMLAGLGSAWAGDVWPQPSSQDFAPQILTVDSTAFTFVVGGPSNGILQRAIARYQSLVFIPVPAVAPLTTSPTGALNGLNISILSNSTVLNFGVDESVC
jgi:hypothetical protein